MYGVGYEDLKRPPEPGQYAEARISAFAGPDGISLRLDGVSTAEPPIASSREAMETRPYYRFKPMKWELTGHRGGVSYLIEETRVVATCRTEENARRVTELLNKGVRAEVREKDPYPSKAEMARVRHAIADTERQLRNRFLNAMTDELRDRTKGMSGFSVHRRALLSFANSVLAMSGFRNRVDLD